MKRFLLPLLAALALPTAVNADLGGADITGKDGSTTTGRVYDASTAFFPLAIFLYCYVH